MKPILDSQQRQAVETDSKRALVISGAGAGKTRTLVERIAYLIEEKNVSPFEVAAFSFTRKASNELKERLHERIGNQAYKCLSGTMHGIALNLIRRFGEFITVNPHNLTVYSEWESSYLLREVAIDMGIYKKKKWSPPKKQIDAMFNDYYDKGIEPLATDPLYGIFKAFLFRCKENNALVYGALLLGLDMLIPTLKKYLHIKHILCDEVQDNSPVQWSIINNMSKEFGASVFVVGDVSQSIYQWRNAVPEYLVEHAHEFDVYPLEMNYRSDKNIVDAANRLIEHNKMRLPLTMEAFEDAQSEIVQVDNVDSEGIVALIGSLSETAPDAKRAVLGRVHGILQKLSRLLEDEGIEHTYIGKKTALTNSENFRRFHAFFKLIVNPFDNFSFLLVHNLLGVTRETYDKIRVKASQEHKSHFQAWQELPGIFDFVSAHDEHGWTLKAAMVYVRTLTEKCGDDYFDEIESFVQSWIDDNPNGDIREYLEHLATWDLQDEMKEEQPLLTLLTGHAAKGCEWPTVIIAGTNEGLIPSKQAIKSGDIEAERRLFYTMITRAEDRLIITTRPTQKVNEKTGNITMEPVSRFIKEMQAT